LFTELNLSRLRPVGGQTQYWDTKQTGLSLLVSAGRGTKTYRSTYALYGKYISRKIGRFGEVSLEHARRITREDRGNATLGRDPKAAKKKALTLYGEVVDEFIEHYAKPRQRTWDQTERVLKGRETCGAWLKRPMASVSKQDVRSLLRGFVADGHPYKAAQTQTWLKSLWRWALRQDLVDTNIMEAVEIDVEKRSRERVYSDAELIAIWKAAEKLVPIECAYIKLVLLLAPRKTALALMKRSDLDDTENPTLWVTPHELTKSKKMSGKKRVYQTPLPSLARRIIKWLPKTNEDRLFRSLCISYSKANQPLFVSGPLTARLVAAGAPADFGYHAVRHTIATFLENEGCSVWERGLVLNHSDGGVTAGYSHGFARDLKLTLLTKWSDHIERLLQPEGAALLR
jgi:hypothetical protein